MPALVASRCLLHPQRESVARCPECRQAYCRECITEHAGRVICAACLRKRTQAPTRPRARFGGVLRPVPAVVGLLVGWFLFYTLGRVLLQIPSEWHESDQVIKLLSR